MGLEELAECHPSPFVRGHAAGWAFLALHALRVEQSMDLVINSFVPFAFGGETLRITVASTAMDKHPDPRKRRPRLPSPGVGHFRGYPQGGRALRRVA